MSQGLLEPNVKIKYVLIKKQNKGIVKGANIMNYLYTNLETTLNIILDVTVNGWITLVTSHSHTH